MKPFDLKAAIAGAPVMTRSVIKVEQIAYFPKAETYQVIALLAGYAEIISFEPDGTCHENIKSMDLVMAPLFMLGGKEYYVGDTIRVLANDQSNYETTTITTENMQSIVAACAAQNLLPPVIKYAQMYINGQGEVKNAKWSSNEKRMVILGAKWLGEPVVVPNE